MPVYIGLIENAAVFMLMKQTMEIGIFENLRSYQDAQN